MLCSCVLEMAPVSCACIARSAATASAPTAPWSARASLNATRRLARDSAFRSAPAPRASRERASVTAAQGSPAPPARGGGKTSPSTAVDVGG